MKLVELNNIQFDDYAKRHPLTSYCQTSKYALMMTDKGYTYDYMGLLDDQGNIAAASLILKKRIAGKDFYGYAPKGLLVNYYDQPVLHEFLTQLAKYYARKDFIFIKFNPEIIIGETNRQKEYCISYNGNVRIIDDLKSMNVKRRIEQEEFELLEPKFSAYINLKNYNIANVERNIRKKIKHASHKGMRLTLGDAKDVEILYNFCKNKSSKPISWYRNFYNIFAKDNSIDLILIKIDYQKYLASAREAYDKEQQINDQINETLQNGKQKIQEKINSDKKLESYKKDVIYATNGLKKKPFDFVAAALVVKHYNRITIVASGYSEEYKSLNPNHYLHHAIFERYKNYFDYCDMYGVTGKFEETSKYHGLNEFKLKYNPTVYEFIGEFDLVCNEHAFKKLIKTSFIEDEFSKK